MMHSILSKKGKRLFIDTYSYDTDLLTLGVQGRWITNRKKYRHKTRYHEHPVFIDTETSHLKETDGWIHQWAAYWAGRFFIGRSAEQLAIFVQHLKEFALVDGADSRVVCYVHNLSYDFEYFRQFIDGNPEVFAVKPHKVLTVRYKSIEFRDSYLLSGKSLDKWSKDSARCFGKLVGIYDYDRIITPADPLTEQDWTYQLNDVASQADAWYSDRRHDGYNIATVPLTTTGFVRERFRAASETDSFWETRLKAMQPDTGVYAALLHAFAGGYTHGNRMRANETVHGPIGHYDFTSSYPARQVLNTFPMGEFKPVQLQSPEDIIVSVRSSATLMQLALKDCRLKDKNCTAPMLGWSKCQRVGKVQPLLDNGRVLEFDGVVTVWFTELDYLMFRRQYHAQVQVLSAYQAPKGRLPKWFIDTVMQLFRDKTELKLKDHVNYMLSKAHLNGCYGMTAQKPVREKINFVSGEYEVEQLSEEQTEVELQKYYKKDSTFLTYAWGVWTTAHARYALFELIEKIGYENFLYCDTDSIFYIMCPKADAAIAAYNAKAIAKAEAAGATAVNHKGQRAVLGLFAPEDDMPIQQFRFLHSKCYALIDRDGELHVTIAGVTKKGRSGSGSNADELRKIDNLQPGFVFRDCGGSRIVYNNSPLHTVTVRGQSVTCGASAIICPTEYKCAAADDIERKADIIAGMFTSDNYIMVDD